MVVFMKQGPVFGKPVEGICYRSRTGAYGVVLCEDGRTAAVRIPTGLFLIGGGIEAGEEPEQSLRREFMEEIGYEIEVVKPLGYASGYYYSGGFQEYMHGAGYFYTVRLLQKVAEPVEKDHELVFLSPEDCVRQIGYDYQRWAVQQAFFGDKPPVP